MSNDDEFALADTQGQRWMVVAAVAGPDHVDALAIGAQTGTVLNTIAAKVCARLPRGRCPFGEYFLVATPYGKAAPDGQGDAVADTLICRVGSSRRERGQFLGRWSRLEDDPRFAQDWGRVPSMPVRP